MNLKYNRKKLHNKLYYVLLTVIIIFITGILFFISPLIILGGFALTQITLIVIGLALGAFLTKFIHELDELTHKHHAGMIFVILIAAFLNLTTLTTSLTILANLPLIRAIISAIVFTASFLIPYIYQTYKR